MAQHVGYGAEVKPKTSMLEPIGWFMTLAVPIILYFILPKYGLDSRAVNYLMVFAITTVMWVFRLYPEVIPAIFLLLAPIILGVVPANIALAGFSSGSFFMALSVFAIGSVLVMSGLTYRISLWLMRIAPQSQIGYESTILLLGIFMTPLIPSANGRTNIIGSIFQNMREIIGYNVGGVAATRLAIAAFSGVSLFSAIFLSSKSINFVVYDLFPAQVKFLFTWGYWVIAAIVALLVLLGGHFLLVWLFFRNQETVPKLNRAKIDEQLKAMGPVKYIEWVAATTIIFFIIGILTVSFHKIQPPWIAFSAFFILMAVGIFSKKMLRQDIDWSFLMLLAGMISITNIMNYLGLDLLLQENFKFAGYYIVNNFNVFLLILAGLVFLTRLILPNNATIILMCSVFLPISEAYGINPWLIGFVILMVSDGWFFSYQCTYYLSFEEDATKDNTLAYNRSKFMFYIWSMNLFRIATIFVSISYWQYLAIL